MSRTASRACLSLIAVSICALLAAQQPASQTPPPKPGEPAARPHGSLPWFAGSYEELGAKARSEQHAVMIYLRAEADPWSERMEREGLSDPRLATALKGTILWNVEFDQGAGKMLARLFGLTGTPVLLFFDSQGAPADRLDGYRLPDNLLSEVERIVRGEDTLQALQLQLAQRGTDIDLRARYIAKLEALGAWNEGQAQREELRKLDTQRRSVPMRRELMAQALAKIEEHYHTAHEINPGPLVRFLESERHAELLFEGYVTLAAMHDQRSRELQRAHQLDAARSKRADQRLALGKAALQLPEQASLRVGFAVNTVEAYTEFRTELNDADRQLMVVLSSRAAELLPDDARVQAACAAACYLNGDKQGAFGALQTSLELSPDNSFARRIAEWMKP
jgi:hypothetical protein